MAAPFFDQATLFDPNFDAAGARTETALGMDAAFGPSTNALSSAQDLEPLIVSPFNPVLNRLNNLGISVESPIIPGSDSRRPAVEGTLVNSEGLPDPPPQPGRK